MAQFSERMDDTQSILTDTATLVGSEDFLPQNVSRAYLDRGNDNPTQPDNASIHTYRSSTSTLRPLPMQHSAPFPADRLADLSSNAVLDEQSLTVPWWTAVLPNPTSVLQRNRNQRRPSVQQGVTDFNADQAAQPANVPLLRNRRTSLLGRSVSNNSSPSSSSDSSFTRLRSVQRSFSTPHSISNMNANISSANASSSSSSNQDDRENLNERLPVPPKLPETYDRYTKCYCEENAYILAAHLNRICQKRNKLKDSTEFGQKVWHWNVDVVFVSNSDKTVALWQQRASQMPETDNIVIWDYHVFVVVTCTSKKGSLERSATRLRSAKSFTNLRNRLPSRSTRSQNSTVSEQSHSRSGSIVVTDYGNMETIPSPRGYADLEGSPPVEDHARSHSWVYDLDSCLHNPVPLSSYLKSTFKADIRDSISVQFRPKFRIIPASTYLAYFASDRSHMIVAPSAEEIETHEAISASLGWINEERMPRKYSSPPPEWSCIRGQFAEQSNLLMEFYVAMNHTSESLPNSNYGVIATLSDLMQGKRLSGHDRNCLADVTNSRNGSDEIRLEEEESVDPSVLRMIDNLESVLSDVVPQSRRRRSRSDENHIRAPSDSSSSESSIVEEDEQSPGFLIGVRRIYGIRPPPPVPEGEDRFARVDFTGRGKRVTNPLFPAYMHATLQSRAAQRQSQANQQTSSSQRTVPPLPPLPSESSEFQQI